MAMSAWVLWLAVVVVGGFWILGVRGAAGVEFPGAPEKRTRWTLGAVLVFAAVIGVYSALALSGVLGRFEAFPPPVVPFFLSMIGLSGWIAFSKYGALLSRHTSFSWLCGFQAFRLLAETLIFLGVQEGIAPRQMSVEGYNFDLLIGLTAIPVALALRKRPSRPLLLAWNLLGMGFLAVIAFIAMTSMPTRLRLFMGEPSNAWVTRFPYVLLPGVLVVAAIAGHLLVFRKLRSTPTLLG